MSKTSVGQCFMFLRNKSSILRTVIISLGALATAIHASIITFRHHDDLKEAMALNWSDRIKKIIKIYAPALLTFGITTAINFVTVKSSDKKLDDDEEGDQLLFYDDLSHEYITCSEETMNLALKKIRVDFFEKGSYSLYDFYSYIGYTPTKPVANKFWINPNFTKCEGYSQPTYFPCQADDMTVYLINFPDNFKEDITNGTHQS